MSMSNMYPCMMCRCGMMSLRAWHRSEPPVHRHERYVSLYDVQVWDDELARVAQKWADQYADMSDMYPCMMCRCGMMS